MPSCRVALTLAASTARGSQTVRENCVEPANARSDERAFGESALTTKPKKKGQLVKFIGARLGVSL